MSTCPKCAHRIPDPHCSNCGYEQPRPLRIVLSCNNPTMETAIRKWAQGKGVEIYAHDPDTPDVIMWSGDVLICDRNFMHSDYWQRYLWLAEEVQDGEQIEYEGALIEFPKKTAIVIDDRADLPMPDPRILNARQVNAGNEMGMRRIIGILDGCLAEYMKRGGAARGC